MPMFIEQNGQKYAVETFKEHRFGVSMQRMLKEEYETPSRTRGEIYGIITRGNGKKEFICLGKNLIVNTAGNVVAQLCRGYTGGNPSISPAAVGISDGPAYGITTVSIGSISPLLSPPPPTLSDTTLGAEYFRRSIASSQYINPTDGTQASVGTSAVDFICSFNAGELTGALTELGLHGGVNAAGVSASAGGGFMFAHRTFPVLNFNVDDQASWTWRIFF